MTFIISAPVGEGAGRAWRVLCVRVSVKARIKVSAGATVSSGCSGGRGASPKPSRAVVGGTQLLVSRGRGPPCVPVAWASPAGALLRRGGHGEAAAGASQRDRRLGVSVSGLWSRKQELLTPANAVLQERVTRSSPHRGEGGTRPRTPAGRIAESRPRRPRTTALPGAPGLGRGGAGTDAHERDLAALLKTVLVLGRVMV